MNFVIVSHCLARPWIYAMLQQPFESLLNAQHSAYRRLSD
jgi:hypothetical protein